MSGQYSGDSGPELFVPATDRDEQGPGAITASPGPYTEAEFGRLCWRVWSLDGADDPTRFDELLTSALAFMANLALAPTMIDPHGAAVEELRAMEQRVLDGRARQP